MFTTLNAEFRFDVDAAATAANALCPVWFEEALTGALWDGADRGASFWCNPPYSQVAAFLQQAVSASIAGARSAVLLVPCRTGTGWWRTYVHHVADEVRMISGRLTYLQANGKPAGSAPFDSAIIIYRPVPPVVAVRTKYRLVNRKGVFLEELRCDER